MSQYSIQPIDSDDLDQLADFLYQSIKALREEGPNGGEMRSRDTILQNLQRTFQAHHADCPDIPFGLKLSKDDNIICGSLLFFPQTYRHQQRTWRALGSGSFFVDPDARMQGFFMFRKYLATKNVDFYFGNTCNSNSIVLWQNCKGVVVPNSDVEYLILLKPAAVFEELVLRKNKPWLRPVARIGGHLAGCLTHWRRNAGLQIEPAKNHEQLAEIALTACPDQCMTADRSVAYLKWHYPTLSPSADAMTSRIYVFSDKQGHQGWFAIDTSQRGIRQQIHAARLMDVVWPREHVNIKQVLHAVTSVLDRSIDMLSVRARQGIELETKLPHAYSRHLPAPESAVLSKSDIPSEALSRIIDFAITDTV